MSRFKLSEEETIEHDGVTLYRLIATEDFKDVKDGDKGGFVDSELALSNYGENWVYDNAKVIGKGVITGGSEVRGNAVVYRSEINCGSVISGSAKVYNSYLLGKSIIKDNASVYNSYIGTDSENSFFIAKDNAFIKCITHTEGQSVVSGNAMILGAVKNKDAEKLNSPVQIQRFEELIIPILNKKAVFNNSILFINNSTIDGNVVVLGSVSIFDSKVFGDVLISEGESRIQSSTLKDNSRVQGSFQLKNIEASENSFFANKKGNELEKKSFFINEEESNSTLFVCCEDSYREKHEPEKEERKIIIKGSAVISSEVSAIFSEDKVDEYFVIDGNAILLEKKTEYEGEETESVLNLRGKIHLTDEFKSIGTNTLNGNIHFGGRITLEGGVTMNGNFEHGADYKEKEVIHHAPFVIIKEEANNPPITFENAYVDSKLAWSFYGKKSEKITSH